MRVMLNTGNINTLFHAQAVNKSIQKGTAQEGNSLLTNRDQAVISPVGKTNNMLEMLMQQKQLLTEQKNSLLEEAGKGIGAADIQEELKALDEKMKSVDAQIAETMTQQLTEEVEQQEKKEGPLTKEELQDARLANITAIASEVEQADTIQSVKNKVDGEISVIEAELRSINGSVAPASQLEELKQRSADVMGQLGEKMADVNTASNEQIHQEVRKDVREDEEKSDLKEA